MPPPPPPPPSPPPPPPPSLAPSTTPNYTVSDTNNRIDSQARSVVGSDTDPRFIAVMAVIAALLFLGVISYVVGKIQRRKSKVAEEGTDTDTAPPASVDPLRADVVAPPSASPHRARLESISSGWRDTSIGGIIRRPFRLAESFMRDPLGRHRRRHRTQQQQTEEGDDTWVYAPRSRLISHSHSSSGSSWASTATLASLEQEDGCRDDVAVELGKLPAPPPRACMSPPRRLRDGGLFVQKGREVS